MNNESNGREKHMYSLYLTEDERDIRTSEENTPARAEISGEMLDMLNTLVLGSSAVTMKFAVTGE